MATNNSSNSGLHTDSSGQNGLSEVLFDADDNEGTAFDLELPRVAVTRGTGSGNPGGFFRIFRRAQPPQALRPRRHRSGNSTADQLRPRIRKYNLLSRDRLKVPMRNSSGHYLSEQGRPLVDVGSDENLDDDDVTYYDSHTMRRLTNSEIREQLLKDGYNLDSQEDADELDLVPPRPIEERGFYCCNYHITCQIL